MNRREWLRLLAAAAAAGFQIATDVDADDAVWRHQYDLPPLRATGRVTLMHMTDTHAQLLPTWYREPSVNLGVGSQFGKPPHLVGPAYLRFYGIEPRSPEAYAMTYLDFEAAARRFGQVGGFAELATLVRGIREQRAGALLLDGGDTWQGSATALWTKGGDMAGACRMLGVDIMTGHWEFTYGAERVMQLCAELQDRIEFLAQNVATSDFGDPVFSSISMREQNGVQVAVIGQAFPYTPVANPAHFVPDWTFGLQEQRLQSNVEVARARGATVVVLLSHCGMDVDLKLAGRIRGLDAILGGHTHDAVPKPVVVPGPTGPCLVTNAGSNGKFLGVLDLITDKRGRVVNHSYKLLPVFASILPKEPEMERYIASVRRPYTNQLAEVLAVTDTLLYRRGNFGGTFDQVILDSMLATQDAQIAFSPGFRWGTTLLPGEQVTMEALMNQTAITYPSTMVTEMTGSTIKDTLEDVCDNLFNPDPYRQQGGDMVRTAGMTYACNPTAAIGERISDLRIKGVPMNADHRYKVASWAPVSKQAQELGGQPIWEIVATYLRDRKVIDARDPQWPKIEAVQGNPGLA